MNRRGFMIGAAITVTSVALSKLPAFDNHELTFSRNGTQIKYDGEYYHLSVPWDIRSARLA